MTNEPYADYNTAFKCQTYLIFHEFIHEASTAAKGGNSIFPYNHSISLLISYSELVKQDSISFF